MCMLYCGEIITYCRFISVWGKKCLNFFFYNFLKSENCIHVTLYVWWGVSYPTSKMQSIYAWISLLLFVCIHRRTSVWRKENFVCVLCYFFIVHDYDGYVLEFHSFFLKEGCVKEWIAYFSLWINFINICLMLHGNFKWYIVETYIHKHIRRKKGEDVE